MRTLSVFRRAFARGVFPYQLAWVLHLPWRSVVLSRRRLVERLPTIRAARVLEVGAGSGYYSIALAESARHLTLLDLQPEMLQRARGNVSTVERVASVAADAAHLPFGAGSLHLIVLVTVLGEIHQQKYFIAEARRVLTSSGVLSISEHLPDPDFMPLRRVRRLVHVEGFRLLSSYGPPWTYTANFIKSDQRSEKSTEQHGSPADARKIPSAFFFSGCFPPAAFRRQRVCHLLCAYRAAP